MKKLNWQTDFLKLVSDRKDTAFKWGVNDCVLFAADAVISMGGEDPAKESRGKYKTETGAKKHLVSKYGDLYRAWDSKLEKITNIQFTQNGDVVVFDGPLGLTSAVYWNGGVFAPTNDGVRFLDEHHSKILASWRV